MARSTTAKTPTKSPGGKALGRGAGGRRARRGGAALSLAVLAILGLALAALPLCILVLGGTLPTAVAAVVDRHRARYLARTVGAMNLAGVLPGALRLWEAGISFSSLEQVIDSPYNWLVMYGAAAVGWMLYFCVPPVVGMVLDVKVDETKRRLEARAKTLVEEWGEEVTGRKS
ncbi:MAG TPA: hypothetical protein VN668_05300 [Stellaceae bacterium]|nr:hypothetical protein [Stellaceae bacterium]